MLTVYEKHKTIVKYYSQVERQITSKRENKVFIVHVVYEPKLFELIILRKRYLLAEIGGNLCKKLSTEKTGNYSSRKFPKSGHTITQQTETLARPS